MGASVGNGNSGYGIGRRGGGTSGSVDDGFKGGTDHHHSVGENLDDVKSAYPYEDGFFGEEAGEEEKRHIYSDDPLAAAHDFYDRIGKGGIEEPLPNGKGVRVTMADGTVISIRDVSESDGTPAVDISIRRSTDSSGVRKQKIHFETERGE